MDRHDTVTFRPERDAPARDAPPSLMPGDVLGDYEILARIGKGGMGEVYAALDRELNRKVALKVLSQDQFASEKRRARLRREAQALAQVVHPNVLSVFAAGEDKGRVYIAMELVEGETLGEWLSRPRPWREVVARFVQAGRGLLAAHRQGLVHRDFKPENVLLGADGRVRVADFGLVAIAGSAGDEPSSPSGLLAGALTETGALVGTPRFMAPEQHRGERADARCDQFAFAAALYGALYGRPAFAGDTVAEVRANALAGRIQDILRSDVPRRLERLVRRGLAPAPEHRFASFADLLAALERGPAITPRRVGAALAAAGAAAAVVLLSTGRGERCAGGAAAIAAVWNADRKAAARAAFTAAAPAVAAPVSRVVDKRLDDYAAAWGDMHGQICRASRSSEQSAAMLDRRMACLQRSAAQLRALVDVFVAADAEVVGSADQAVARLPELDRCADLGALAAEAPLPTEPNAAARVSAVAAQVATARAYLSTNRLDDGRRAADAALREARATGYQPVIADAAWTSGELAAGLGDYAAAEPSFAEAVQAALAGGAEERAALAAAGLADALAWREHPDEALRWLATGRSLFGRAARRPAAARYFHIAAAGVLRGVARPRDAVAEMRAAVALAADAPAIEAVYARHHLGVALVTAGDWREAETVLEGVADWLDKTYGDHPNAVAALGFLSLIARNRDAPDLAIARAEKSLAMAIRVYGPDHLTVATGHNDLGESRLVGGDVDGARREFEEALRIAAKLVGDDAPFVGYTLFDLAAAAHEAGRRDEAVGLVRRALDILGSSTANRADSADVRVLDGTLQRELGRLDESSRQLTTAADIVYSIVGRDHPGTVHLRLELARTENARGHVARGREVLEEAVALVDGNPNVAPSEAAEARLELARALGDDQRARARALAARALLGYAGLAPRFAKEAGGAAAWLADHK